MPRSHRDTDSRFCGATTIVTGQSTVYVNNLLQSVEGDKDTHCNAGDLIAVYGPKNYYVENKLAICAVGDSAAPDFQGCVDAHPTGATNPKGHSNDTFIYEGGSGGGTVTQI